MYIPDAMSTEGCGSHHDLCSTYCDEEVDRALATIDAAWPNCFPDHIDDAKKLKKKSHQAVKTLRQFRGEVLSWTKEAIGHGDTDLLAPGEGPATLLKSLGRVSEYMEAKSRKVVEDARREVIQHFFEFGVWPETQQRSAGKPLTYSRLSKELQKSVRLHVEPVIDAAEGKLIVASGFGPRDAQRWGAVAAMVYEAAKRVDRAIELGHPSMNCSKTHLEVNGRLSRMEAGMKDIKEQVTGGRSQVAEIAANVSEGTRQQVEMAANVTEGRRRQEEIAAKQEEVAANMMKTLDRLGLLKDQIDVVLKELDAVRICQANDKIPRGFFLVPADKTTWSWTKHADCFSLYTRNVQLFFVCRMFFEELKKVAGKSEAERDALIAGRSNIQFEHEFSDPIPLELPRKEVADHLHAIRLSVKVVRILVDAASLGLSLGNAIPNLSLTDQDALLNVMQEHLASAEEQAAGGEPAEGSNLVRPSRRWKRFWKSSRKPTATPKNARSLATAHEALQGFLDEHHRGIWPPKVHSKLVATANMDRTNYAYICKKTDKHKLDWTTQPPSTIIS